MKATSPITSNGRKTTALRILANLGIDTESCGLLKLEAIETSNLACQVDAAIQLAVREIMDLKRTSRRKADAAYHADQNG